MSSWHTTTSAWLVSPCTDDVFGGRAIELAGRVIRPDYQGQGIGASLLGRFVETHQPSLLTTYTRNPSVLKMMRTVAPEVYPATSDDELQELATEMPFSTLDTQGVAYHIDRYGEGGLFQGFDPADYPLDGPIPLKESYPGLQNIRSALVVAARINKEIYS